MMTMICNAKDGNGDSDNDDNNDPLLIIMMLRQGYDS